MRRMAMIPLVGLATLGLSGTLHAQSCILCYTSAANAGPGGIRALDMGIISLLIPALLLFIGVCLLIVRRARLASRAEESDAKAPAAPSLLATSPARKVAPRPRSASAPAYTTLTISSTIISK
jgi:hypothetical protein